MVNRYRIDEDSRMLREIKRISQEELADSLGVGTVTVSRWENRLVEPAPENLEKFYSFAYKAGIRINSIKEQFYIEEMDRGQTLLFHGAKTSIDGAICPDAARDNNDFGKGFYMGESFRQAALFVSNFDSSCVYCVGFDENGLIRAEYSVDTEWMMTIACFRGRLRGRIPEAKERQLCEKAQSADYIVAPIADNRMYQIIDSFIDGEITDEQCRHALAATELGMQYVVKSKKAAERVSILERCYLCVPEKNGYVTDRRDDLKVSEDKVRAARIRYRGKGKYIDELI